jgi:cell division protein FtsI (penicillin-binding protein 3)
MNRISRHPTRRMLLAAVGVFLVRLVDIQVVRAAELSKEAEGRRSATVTDYGTRGDIVDANGIVLADSAMRYDIAISPKNAGPIDREEPDPADAAKTKTVEVPLAQLEADLGAVIGLTAEQVQGVIDAALAENPDDDFEYVAKLVDTATYEKVKELDIPWVVPYEHPSRRYPNGAVAGNLLGFVGTDGDALAGIELSEDECLAGEDGEISYQYSLEDWVPIPGTQVVHKRPAVDGAADRRGAGAGRRRRLGHGHGHGGEDRPTHRGCRRADDRPEQPHGDRGGRSRFAFVHGAVRARLDVQGADGRIRHRRRQGRSAQPDRLGL